jgi:hypothetical protein
MFTQFKKLPLGCWWLLISVAMTPPIFADTFGDKLGQLRTLSSSDDSNRLATKLSKQLHSDKNVPLLQVLKSMKDATPIGRNWLIGLSHSIYQRSGKSSKDDLEKFLSDTTQDGEARYTVFEWLTEGDEASRKAMLATMKQDPSPELRYQAVKEILEGTPTASDLQSILESARHPDQIVDIIAKLKEEKIDIDQAKQFGFLMNWKLIGPFDHVGSANFDKVFPIESDWLSGEVQAEYPGKSGTVKWLEETTDDKEGAFDLAKIFANEKGCIIYAMTEFEATSDLDAEVRLGCINANKIWINSKLVMSNEVYHTSMQIDQYSEATRLKSGANRILVKICQNEQKEQWAQRYAFQLRISDSTGKAILEKGR